MVPLLFAILAVSPLPAPTPHLKTIITVSSSPFCGAFAAHVNAAIGSAVDNDQSLAEVVTDLRSGDLGGSSLRRSNDMQRLSNLSSAIYKQFRAGEAEVRRLRELARKTADPDERLDVKAAADALGGALYRQHLVQRDLDGFVAFLYASEMASNDGTDWHTPDPGFGADSESLQLRADPAQYWVPGSYRTPATLMVGQDTSTEDARMAAATADDFQTRMVPIFEDEMNAGPHIESAGDHC